jgi:hypothetical protein
MVLIKLRTPQDNTVAAIKNPKTLKLNQEHIINGRRVPINIKIAVINLKVELGSMQEVKILHIKFRLNTNRKPFDHVFHVPSLDHAPNNLDAPELYNKFEKFKYIIK